jgi:hypothetical protein
VKKAYRSSGAPSYTNKRRVGEGKKKKRQRNYG